MHAHKPNPRTNNPSPTYNFTVAVRVKPILAPNSTPHISYSSPDPQTLVVQYPQSHTAYCGARPKKYNFDRILVDTSNRELYWAIVRPKLLVLLDNMNLTLLTYGITGSGKTHTIFGNQAVGEEGIAKLCFQDAIHLFTQGEMGQRDLDQPNGNSNADVSFGFSFLQIYNEQVQDLLQDGPVTQQDSTGSKLKSLQVMQDSKGKINIPQLTRVPIKNASDLDMLIEHGNKIRACSSNNINKLSSRSHALMQLFCYNKKTKIENVVTIIDLAGSERSQFGGRDLSRDKDNSHLQKEGSNINRSLLALGSCIKGLEAGEPHIPYRDSKLTRILKQDLSGRAHNVMIACVGRNYAQCEETINTLQYASRAAKIKVEKLKNAPKNEAFECGYCFRLTPWRQIMERIPESLSSMNSTHPKPPNLSNPDFISKLFAPHQPIPALPNTLQQSLSAILDKLKRQILDLVHPSLTPFSFPSPCLFPDDPHNSSQQSTCRQIMSSGINDIFALYEQQMCSLADLYANQCVGDANLHEDSLNGTLKMKHNLISNATETVNKKDMHNQGLVGDCAIAEFSKTVGCINVTSHCDLESYRDQVLGDYNFLGSNLRKKLSLKNKNYLNSVNSTNTTLSDGNKQEQQIGRGRTQRMNLDIDLDDEDLEKKSQKSAIIRKIEQARKKCMPVNYSHQNLSRIQFQDQVNPRHVQAKPRQRVCSFLSTKDMNSKDQVYVSSFMEDCNQF